MIKSLTERVELATQQVESAGEVYSEVKCADSNTMVETECGIVPSLRKVLKDIGGYQYKGVWMAGTVYEAKDQVKDFDGAIWLCIEDHTASADFNSDTQSGKWIAFQVIIDSVLFNRRVIDFAKNVAFGPYQEDGRTLLPRLRIGAVEYVAISEISENLIFISDDVDDQFDGTVVIRTSDGDKIFSKIGAEAVSRLYLDETIKSIDYSKVQVLSSQSTMSRILSDRFADIVNAKDFGAFGDGITNDTENIKFAIDISNKVYFPKGVYRIDKGEIDYSKVYGEGLFKINDKLFPAGNIKSETALHVPECFDYIEVFEKYIITRRLFNPTTVRLDSGTINVDMTKRMSNIKYEHCDGGMLSIIGNGKNNTILKFDFTGKSAQRLYGIGINGTYTINLVDGITFDGNNYSGHKEGDPTLGNGDARDPIGCKVMNGGSIEFGDDNKIIYFARNGILVNENSYCLANKMDVNNCGSDAYVASIGSTLYVNSSKCFRIFGDAYFADRGGKIFCYDSVAYDIYKRFSGTAGDGLVAVEGGQIFANNTLLQRIEDVGILCFTGGEVYGDDIQIATSRNNRCGSYGMHLQGGKFQGVRFKVAYSENHNIFIENGGSFSSDGVQSIESAGDGIKATEVASCIFTTGTISNNKGSGVNITGCYASGSSSTIENNEGYGVIARYSGKVYISNSVVSGNKAGDFSPSKDETSGVDDSKIYI